jgi:hypothetical protein
MGFLLEFAAEWRVIRIQSTQKAEKDSPPSVGAGRESHHPAKN